MRPDNARAACRSVGWPDELIAGTEFTDDAAAMMASGKVDVVVEATGNPIAGIRHAQKAIENGVHIVMVNVEADVLAGAALAHGHAALARYSMAYGVSLPRQSRWWNGQSHRIWGDNAGKCKISARLSWFPDTVWDHYGLTAEQPGSRLNSQMFNSFWTGQNLP